VDYAAADWALSRGESSGQDTATLNAADWQFHPLRTSLGVLAVFGISNPSGATPLSPERRVLFATLLGQAALAHERLRLEEEGRRAATLEQRDKLRTTLVSSLGHDLKTPLTAVVAAAEALAVENPCSSTATTLLSQATRLRRLFDDLVEMTRLESGTLAMRREAVDLTDAVAAAVHDLRSELAGHKVELAVPPSLPLVEADPRMLHHILVNLFDNAAKYAPQGTVIRAEGGRTHNGITLAIIDEGAGLPAGEENRLFEQFCRVEGGDRQGGTGLGLAIVKGFAEALGLIVKASNRTDVTGSRFSLTWPEALIRKVTVIPETMQ
jgi:two-component system sensor histidine kinase KdpD